MKSATINAFFSCSFREGDKVVNDFFKSICEGLDIRCHNVDGGYKDTPPEKAREMLSEASAVIAVATARNQLHDSKDFAMPEAVSNEISMAYGFKKPLLIIKEKSVKTEGFLGNYATHLEFERSSLSDPAFIKRAVHSIHNIKLHCISDHELAVSQEITEFVAENVSHLIELQREGGGYIWKHSMQRRINFTKTFNKPLKLSRWNDFSDGKSSEGLRPIELEFEIVKSSKKFEPLIKYEEQTAFSITANVSFSPQPMAGDFIDYFVSYRGEHLCPIYEEDAITSPGIDIDGTRYLAFDGIIPVNRAKDLEIQFRFPREYRLDPHDTAFFVGSFTQGIDYIVLSEISRAEVLSEIIGGTLVITAKITSPLLRHVYGVAWIPPNRPADE